MSNDNVLTAPVTTILAAYTYFVTLTGVINPASANGGIGPSIATVTITQTIRVDGMRCTPVYAVAFDGEQQCGGVAEHLDGDPTRALANLCIVHGYPVEAIAPSVARTVGQIDGVEVAQINAQRAWDALTAAITFEAVAWEDEDSYHVAYRGEWVGLVEITDSTYGTAWRAFDNQGREVACETHRIDSAAGLVEALGLLD